MESFEKTIARIQEFKEDSLTGKLNKLQMDFYGANLGNSGRLLIDFNIDQELLKRAFLIKETSKQINVIIHAIGILLSLPAILNEGEEIMNLSLGAGSAGDGFDLQTNFRIAEYKFIQWQAKGNAVRQKNLFEDYYKLAEFKSDRKKYIYVLGLDLPLKFLKSSRKISVVLSRNGRMWEHFRERYGEEYKFVREYYEHKKSEVEIVDLRKVSKAFDSF